jgi:hypothetical protein
MLDLSQLTVLTSTTSTRKGGNKAGKPKSTDLRITYQKDSFSLSNAAMDKFGIKSNCIFPVLSAGKLLLVVVPEELSTSSMFGSAKALYKPTRKVDTVKAKTATFNNADINNYFLGLSGEGVYEISLVVDSSTGSPVQVTNSGSVIEGSMVIEIGTFVRTVSERKSKTATVTDKQMDIDFTSPVGGETKSSNEDEDEDDFTEEPVDSFGETSDLFDDNI